MPKDLANCRSTCATRVTLQTWLSDTVAREFFSMQFLATGGENQPSRHHDYVHVITETSWTMFASFISVYDGARLWTIIDIRQSKDLSFYVFASRFVHDCVRSRETRDRPHTRCLPVPRTSRVEIFRHNDLKIPINVCKRLILQWLHVYLPSTKWNGSTWHRITIRMRNRVMISFKKSDWSILRFARICANLRGMWLRRDREYKRAKFFYIRCLQRDVYYSQIKGNNIFVRMFFTTNMMWAVYNLPSVFNWLLPHERNVCHANYSSLREYSFV